MNDYYTFGMLVPTRNYSSPSYRYGFQGQEKDDEIKGNGNSINYKFRMHDPRVGRFFAVDPLAAKYPYYSQYAFSGNRVIDMVELEGLEPAKPGEKQGQVGNAKNHSEGELEEDDPDDVVQKWITDMGADGKSPTWYKVDHYNTLINDRIDEVVHSRGGLSEGGIPFMNRPFENSAIKEQWEIKFSEASANNEVYQHFLKTGAIYTDDFNSPIFWFTGALSKVSKLKPSIVLSGDFMISTRLSWLKKSGGTLGKNQGRMGRHILDHPDFVAGKSYFKNIGEAENILKAFHSGKTTILKQVNSNTVIVKYTEATGYYSNASMIRLGKSAEVSHIFKLEGTNSVKVYPLNPKNY